MSHARRRNDGGGQQQDKAAKDKDAAWDKDKRPKLTLTARPPIGMSPARVAITAELVGGPNDLEDFYCPTDRMGLGRRDAVGNDVRLRAV